MGKNKSRYDKLNLDKAPAQQTKGTSSFKRRLEIFEPKDQINKPEDPSLKAKPHAIQPNVEVKSPKNSDELKDKISNVEIPKTADPIYTAQKRLRKTKIVLKRKKEQLEERKEEILNRQKQAQERVSSSRFTLMIGLGFIFLFFLLTRNTDFITRYQIFEFVLAVIFVIFGYDRYRNRF